MADHLAIIMLAFVALITSIGSTWCVRWLALKFNIVNHPNKIVPQHTKPIAYLGGLGIFVGFFIATTTSYLNNSLPFPHLETLRFWFPSVVFLFLGLIDDLKVLSPAPKFCLQLLAAVVAVSLGNTMHVFDWAWVNAVVSFLAIIFLVNAFNLTDVCDGLVAGLTIVALILISILYPTNLVLCLLMAGSCLGFWLYNKPPATIFLGDAGSHLLGFWCAYLLLNTANTWQDGVSGTLIVGIPIFETIFITIVRIQKKLPWWKGSPDHFSLRMQKAGFTKLQTDLAAWSTALLLGIAALAFSQLNPLGQIIILTFVFILFWRIWKWLLKIETKPQTKTP